MDFMRLKFNCRVRDWRGSCDAVRLQPLPIRTAREVFPQAAHPASFVKRVMCRVVLRRLLSRKGLYPRYGPDGPVPVQPKDIVEIFVTPSPLADTSLPPPSPSRKQGTDLHL